jgi:tellurite resistance protein TerB
VDVGSPTNHVMSDSKSVDDRLHPRPAFVFPRVCIRPSIACSTDRSRGSMPKISSRNPARRDLTDALPQNTEAMMTAFVAGCAMVALADGHLHPDEQQRLLRAMRRHPALSVFSRFDVLGEIEIHRESFARTPIAAVDHALDLIHALQPTPSQARTIYDACIAVALADGRLEVDELCALNRVRAALGDRSFQVAER